MLKPENCGENKLLAALLKSLKSANSRGQASKALVRCETLMLCKPPQTAGSHSLTPTSMERQVSQLWQNSLVELRTKCLWRPFGHITPKGWSKLPNGSLCRPAGKVTPCKSWSNQVPKDKLSACPLAKPPPEASFAER